MARIEHTALVLVGFFRGVMICVYIGDAGFPFMILFFCNEFIYIFENLVNLVGKY